MQRPDCLWCSRELAEEEYARGNLCAGCMQVTTGVPSLSIRTLDKLPFGVIHLNRHGEIIAFNEAEERFSGHSRESVVGRNFFDVAPCADVKEFRGRFLDFLDGTSLAESFDYTYYFSGRAVAVTLTFLRANQQLGFVLSSRKSQ